MPLFRKAAEMGAPFRRNETVVATEPLPGVPEGTQGKIKMINGFSWIRYWVFFDNGVELGSIDSAQLVRPEYLEQFYLDRDQRLADEARAAEARAAGQAIESTAAAATEAADPSDPLAALRALVPPHLLERSAAARARLGA